MKIKFAILLGLVLVPLTTQCTKKRKSVENVEPQPIPSPDSKENAKPYPNVKVGEEVRTEEKAPSNENSGEKDRLTAQANNEPEVVAAPEASKSETSLFHRIAGRYETNPSTTVTKSILGANRSPAFGTYYQWSQDTGASTQDIVTAQMEITVNAGTNSVNLMVNRTRNGVSRVANLTISFSECSLLLNSRYCAFDNVRMVAKVAATEYFVGDLSPSSLVLDDRFSNPRTYSFMAGNGTYSDRVGERLEIIDLGNEKIKVVVMFAAFESLRFANEAEIRLEFDAIKTRI